MPYLILTLFFFLDATRTALTGVPKIRIQFIELLFMVLSWNRMCAKE